MKYALIGEKLGHSYSKIIHEKFFDFKKSDSSYDLLEIPIGELYDKICLMKQLGYSGFNVTIPYKIDVMNMCTELSDVAKKIGSVNTVLFKKEGMYGANTDYFGLMLALEESKVSLSGKSVVVLGTGGASKAVCALAEDLGCSELTLVSRNIKNIPGCRCITYNQPRDGDIIINTTPVGMYPNVDFSPIDDFSTFETAVDLIYNPDETMFLKLAKKRGLTTVNGLYMLVAQALWSQSIWRGENVDRELVCKIYNELRGL